MVHVGLQGVTPVCVGHRGSSQVTTEQRPGGRDTRICGGLVTRACGHAAVLQGRWHGSPWDLGGREVSEWASDWGRRGERERRRWRWLGQKAGAGGLGWGPQRRSEGTGRSPVLLAQREGVGEGLAGWL